MSAAPRPAPARASQRAAARLAAAQILYEMEMTRASADAALADHLADRWRRLPADTDAEGNEEAAETLIEPDPAHLGAVVRGAVARGTDIDRMIEGALNRGWTLGRLEALLRAILRCGVYELLALRDVPPRVVINEYMDVAKAFYAGTEPTLVNGILDRLARVLRADAFAPAADGGAKTSPAGDNGDNRA